MQGLRPLIHQSKVLNKLLFRQLSLKPIVIMNKDADSSKYEPIKHLLRPGHANYTYLENQLKMKKLWLI